MQSAGILLIDDDRRLAEMVGRYLGQAGFSVQVQGTARAGLEALAERTPDLILLDLMLPDGDGLDVCRQIRQRGGLAARVPILMLTARGETTDRVVGLEVGADDYLPKPFEPRELLARVRALLRRAAPVDVSSGGGCRYRGVDQQGRVTWWRRAVDRQVRATWPVLPVQRAPAGRTGQQLQAAWLPGLPVKPALLVVPVVLVAVVMVAVVMVAPRLVGLQETRWLPMAMRF